MLAVSLRTMTKLWPELGGVKIPGAGVRIPRANVLQYKQRGYVGPDPLVVGRTKSVRLRVSKG